MEYIEREAALEAIMKPKVSPNAEIFNALKKACQEEVKNLPAADVAPVRHGRYIIDDMGDSSCSECGEKWLDVTQNYCPNCGAKMDGCTE